MLSNKRVVGFGLCALATMAVLVLGLGRSWEQGEKSLEAATEGELQPVRDVCSQVSLGLLARTVTPAQLIEVGWLLTEYVKISDARFEAAGVSIPVTGLGNLGVERYTSGNTQFCYTVEIPLFAELDRQGLEGKAELALAFL